VTGDHRHGVTQLGAAFAALHDPTVKPIDRQWWSTRPPERLAQSAALLSVHPGLPVPDADVIAFRLEIPGFSCCHGAATASGIS
jgi:hypothetical protein